MKKLCLLMSFCIAAVSANAQLKVVATWLLTAAKGLLLLKTDRQPFRR